MDNETRDLFQMVMNGKYELLPIMHQLSRYRDHKKFLKWLFLNGITGQNLFEWLKIKFNNSTMSMVKFIVKHHNKNIEEKPIFLGRDWK